jgi:hypothetical protein
MEGRSEESGCWKLSGASLFFWTYRHRVVILFSSSRFTIVYTVSSPLLVNHVMLCRYLDIRQVRSDLEPLEPGVNGDAVKCIAGAARIEGGDATKIAVSSKLNQVTKVRS